MVYYDGHLYICKERPPIGEQKQLTRFTVSVFCESMTVYVNISFPLSFEDGMWDLIYQFRIIADPFTLNC